MSTIQTALCQFAGRLMPTIVTGRIGAAERPANFQRRSNSVLVALLVLAATQPAVAQNGAEEQNSSTVRRSPPADERYFDAVKISSNNTTVDLTERFSKDLKFSERITNVDGHDPDVISVIPSGTSGLRIRGLAQGVTTMIVTGASTQRYVIEVYVC